MDERYVAQEERGMPDFTALRSMVSRFLTDTCTITGAETVAYDPELGEESETAGAAIYTGVCRVRPANIGVSRGGRFGEVGEARIGWHLYAVWLPWDTTGVDVDDIVTVTSIDDPYLAGRRLRVLDVQGGSDAAHLLLSCEDIVQIDEGGS